MNIDLGFCIVPNIYYCAYLYTLKYILNNLKLKEIPNKSVPDSFQINPENM